MEHIDDHDPRSDAAAAAAPGSGAAGSAEPGSPAATPAPVLGGPASAGTDGAAAPTASRRETAADVCAWFGFVPTALLVVSFLVLSALPGEIALNALIPFFGIIATGWLWTALAITALVLGLRRPRRLTAVRLAVATLALYGVVVAVFGVSMAVAP